MRRDGQLELANDNVAAGWLARARALGWESRTTARYTAVWARAEGPHSAGGGECRIVVTRPYSDARALERELAELAHTRSAGPLCVEDPYGGLDFACYGWEASLPQAVMVCEPRPAGRGRSTQAGSAGAVDGAGAQAGAGVVDVVEAVDGEDLALVERVVVEGFPVPARLPWRPGEALPRALFHRTGWRAWLGRRGGAPTGACASFDDGQAVGLYWVATLPEHRSHGVARAVVSRALQAYPDRPAALTATLLGEPLYRKLGFTEQGTARWWRRPAVPRPASGWP